MYGHRVFLRIGELPAIDIAGLFKDAYELLNCSYSFTQGSDDKGKVQTEVYGGTFYITLPNLPPNFIVRWALNSRKYENGVIVICDADNIPLEKVYFKEAACVSMEIESAQQSTNYITTRLVLKAKEVQINDVKFENKWT